MTISLHLIWGPTTTGKTKVAIELSRQTGAPVIALDRVQCCPELATGSGRPALRELQGTPRLYIASRSLSEGMLTAGEANRRLKLQVQECARTSPLVILEGGSVSLFNEMAADPWWARECSWRFTRLHMPEPVAFLARARQRVREMLHPEDGSPSLLQELAIAWHDMTCRATLEDVDGYRAAIELARRHRLSVAELLHVQEPLEVELVDAIAVEYLRHARWQESEFHRIPQAWRARQSERLQVPAGAPSVIFNQSA